MNQKIKMYDNLKFENLRFLDGLRGLAALYVMIGHSRWLLWEGYQEFTQHPQTYSTIEKANLYALSIFRYGHQAVMLFIVLSGFVIHLKNAELLKINAKHDIGIITFYLNRVLRIYPPYLIVIIITFGLDSIGQNLGYSIYTSQTKYDLINNCITIDVSFLNLKYNLFFFGGINKPVWGSNGPIWSLSLEWWFYMFYPIILYTHRVKKWLPTLIIVLIFLTVIFFKVENNLFQSFFVPIFSMMLCWWFGVILAEIYVGKIDIRLNNLFFFVFAFVFIPIVHIDLWKDVIVSIGFVGVISFLLNNNLKLQRVQDFLNSMSTLGNISYSLYIIHFPILVFLSGWLMNQNNGRLPQSQLYIYIGAIISILAAFFLYFIGEKPSQQLRKKVTSKISSLN